MNKEEINKVLRELARAQGEFLSWKQANYLADDFKRRCVLSKEGGDARENQAARPI